MGRCKENTAEGIGCDAADAQGEIREVLKARYFRQEPFYKFRWLPNIQRVVVKVELRPVEAESLEVGELEDVDEGGVP